MVLIRGKRFRYGVSRIPGFSDGLETFHDGSWWLTVRGIVLWCHRAENPSVGERGVW